MKLRRTPPPGGGVKRLTRQQKSDIAFLRKEDTKIMEIDGRAVGADCHDRKHDIIELLDTRRATLQVTDSQVLNSKCDEEEIRVVFMLNYVAGSSIQFVAMQKKPHHRGPTFHWKKMLPGSYGSTQ